MKRVLVTVLLLLVASAAQSTDARTQQEAPKEGKVAREGFDLYYKIRLM